MDGLELGASKLQFACSPLGEKIVQWTILRKAREKQVRPAAPIKKDRSSTCLFLLVVNNGVDKNNRDPTNCRRNLWEEEQPQKGLAVWQKKNC